LCCLSFFDLLLRYFQTFLVRDHSMTIHIFFGSIKIQLVSEKKMLVFCCCIFHFPYCLMLLFCHMFAAILDFQSTKK
jgi:hypothetical protein